MTDAAPLAADLVADTYEQTDDRLAVALQREEKHLTLEVAQALRLQQNFAKATEIVKFRERRVEALRITTMILREETP